MQRITITLDDDLLDALDQLSQRRGYHNRSEAIRDTLRDALALETAQAQESEGFAVLSYVYEHEKRDLASRIVATQHHLSLIHISEPTRRLRGSRMPSSA